MAELAMRSHAQPRLAILVDELERGVDELDQKLRAALELGVRRSTSGQAEQGRAR